MCLEYIDNFYLKKVFLWKCFCCLLVLMGNAGSPEVELKQELFCIGFYIDVYINKTSFDVILDIIYAQI